MPLEQFVFPDLDQPAVARAIEARDPDLVDPMFTDRRQQVLNSGFKETGQLRSAGSADIADEAGLRPLFFTVVKSFNLRERHDDSPPQGPAHSTHPIVVREVSAKSVWQVRCSLTIDYELFLRDAPEVDDDAILQAWADFQIGDDPNQFASDQGISAGDFWALARWTLVFGEETAVMAPKDPDDANSPQRPLDQLTALYQLYDTSRNEPPFGKYRLDPLRDSRFAFVEDTDEGDVIEGDVTAPDLSQQEGRQIEEAQSSATICNGFEFKAKSKRVGTIFAWPEFRINWERKSIKIGCARISIKVPYLQRRTGKKVLMATVAYPDAGVIFEKIILRCLTEAAISSALVGLITAQAQLALVAFKTYLENCVKMHATRYVECLVPKLYVVREASSWKRV